MPRKGENIYKRKDGRWEGRYIKSRSSTGKAVYGYVYAKTYREVKSRIHEAQVSVASPTKEISYSMELFDFFAESWFESKQTQLKESTRNKYRNILDAYVLPDLGNKLLSEITYETIEEHCQYLLSVGGKSGKGLSAKTVVDILSLIRNILKFAIRKGKAIPCDGTSVQIKNDPSQMRIFSRSEQEQLCQYLYSHTTPCNIGTLICLFTGLRIGEICALRWEDFSQKDQTIRVHQTLQRIQAKDNSGPKTKIVITSPKSMCSLRTIPIPDTLLEILMSYKCAEKGFILTNSDTVFIEPRTMQNNFKKALQASGIEDANFHTTRHTFATRCIELGFDVKTLSEILGHATVNITMNRYVHPTMDLKRANMQKLSTLFSVK